MTSRCFGTIGLRLVLVAVLLAFPASGAPSIASVSGALVQGGSIVLGGSGFGVKDPAAPLRYDSFENGVVGQRLSSWEQGGWDTVGSIVYPRYGNGRARVPGEHVAVQSYLMAPLGFYNQQIGIYNRMNLTNVYATWWAYRDDVNGTALCSDNQKLNGNLGRHNSSSGAAGMPQQRADQYSYWGSGHLYSTDYRGQNPIHNYYPFNGWLDNWHRIERYSNTQTRDNYAYLKRNGELVAEIDGDFKGSDDYEYNYFVIGQFFRRGVESIPNIDCKSELVQYLGELYVDVTPARVEVCDVSSWGASAGAHCEIQVPVAWNNGSIQFTANLGAFKAGDPLFLYVVDGERNANEIGFSVNAAGLANSFCGNGKANYAEECDGADLGRYSCEVLGFDGGILGCYPAGSPSECTFDVSSCQPQGARILDTRAYVNVRSYGAWINRYSEQAQGKKYVYALYPNSWFELFTPLAPGEYAVQVRWITYNPGVPRSATYVVNHAAGQSQFAVDQQNGGAQWNSLGTFTFGSEGSVRLIANTSNATFDAVRFVPLDGQSPPSATPVPSPSPSPSPGASPSPSPTSSASPSPSPSPSPAACSPDNSTQNCTVGSCNGIQTCTGGVWGTCIKLDACCGVDCNDNNACTADSCAGGACSHSGSCPTGGSPGGSSGGSYGGSSGGFPAATATPSRQANSTPTLSSSPTPAPVRFVEVPQTNEEIENALLELPAGDSEASEARAIVAEAKNLESQGRFEAAKALWAKAKEKVTGLLAKARANKASYNYWVAGLAALALVGGAVYYSSTLGPSKPKPPSVQPPAGA